MKTFLVHLIRRQAYGMELARPMRKAVEVKGYNEAAAEIFALHDNEGWDRETSLGITVVHEQTQSPHQAVNESP